MANYLLLAAGMVVAAGLWLGLLFVIDAVMKSKQQGTLITVHKEDSS